MRLHLNVFVAVNLLITASHAIEIHVAPHGNDGASATADQPCATLHRAQELVRVQSAKGLNQAIHVLIQPGTYELTEPLLLKPEDSGTNEYPITWKAADPESKPLLSGGTLIEGVWRESDKKGIWYVDVPGTKNKALRMRASTQIRVSLDQVKLEGTWEQGQLAGNDYFVRKTSGENDSSKAIYTFDVKESGSYQLELVNMPHANRPTKTLIEIDAGETKQQVIVDQRQGTRLGLGVFELTAGKSVTVSILCKEAKGYVVASDLRVTWAAEDTGWNFRQLFIDGKRATRARFPNMDESDPFMYATGGGMDHARIDPALITPSWGKEPDAQINIVVQWMFFNQWNTVKAVDADSGSIFFTDSERHGRVTPGNWFWIEGVFEELDQPGEWYLHRGEGRLYYMPEPGKDPNAMKFVAPRLQRLIYTKGDIDNETHVGHVHFKNLEFRDTRFTLGHIAPRVHTDAAVMFENTRDSSITNCHFENIGGYALWLHLDSQRNHFDQNTVLNSGGGGVLLTGARLSYMDDSKIYTPGEANSRVAPILNHITHNTVKHCGQKRYYGGGVHLDSRPFNMSMTPGNYIAHNHFEDLSRNGIFAFRNQGGNVIEYNHIHDVMQTTIDGACIHFATMNHLNAPNYILTNWLYDIWGFKQQPNAKPDRVLANGIFLDWDSSNMIVKDNYIYNAGGKPLKMIWDNWNVVHAGNKFQADRIVPPFLNELGPAGSATHSIDLESNHLIGSVVHYSDADLVEHNGPWTKKSITGLRGLFDFKLLEAQPDVPAEITYTLPITKDGVYQISLLYKAHKSNASNAKIEIQRGGGVETLRWDMRQGHKHGFAVEIGKYAFKASEPARIVISNKDANGTVVADSVAFVKVEP